MLLHLTGLTSRGKLPQVETPSARLPGRGSPRVSRSSAFQILLPLRGSPSLYRRKRRGISVKVILRQLPHRFLFTDHALVDARHRASQTHVQASNPFWLDSVRKHYSHICKSPGSLTQQRDIRILCSETHLNPRRPSK